MQATSLLLSTLLAAALALAGCAAPTSTTGGTPGAAAAAEPAPVPATCPTAIPAGTRCLSGRDAAGAYYLIAIPPDWKGELVLHAHGGPTLGPPQLARTMEDLARWAVVVKSGYAWAGTSFRQGGVAVHAAAEDAERLRQIFVRHVARPKFTILHGQSWGASVAAVGASMFTSDASGARPYDAVLLTSGVLAGGSHAYDFRLDLRAVYQALCANHPRPDEAPYPLWMGLPAGAKMTTAALNQRIDECLGPDKPAGARTPEQQRKVRAIVDVLKIPTSSIRSHLAWGTFHFQEIAQRLGGTGSPFGNARAQYRGSADDVALNRSVLRYEADPRAMARFAADTDPDGHIPVPVLTAHGIDDPTAFVEMDDSFRRTMEKAGTAGHLVQTFTADDTHSYLTDAAYVTLLSALSSWAKGGAKPTPSGIEQQCRQHEPAGGGQCRFRPGYSPQPLTTRVAPRE